MRILFVVLVLAVSCQATGNSTSTKKPANEKKPGDDRGKRNLFDIGNYGYARHPIQRRLGYSESFSSGYDAPTNFGQHPSNFLPDYSYPHPHQYQEPPEPIIEIIIKESNETVPTHAPQPYVHKKKKEHVQVFYVNYKKDKNNKLHLETPIASLTPKGNSHHEDEEQIIHYPVVTPPPRYKTTTLRTIIHPDSEKYHSNSGIHVTFGTEDKNQHGHILQEHNEESVVRSVVALPNPTNFIHDPQRPGQPHILDARFDNSHFRSNDAGQSRAISNNNFGSNQFKEQFTSPPVAQTYVSQQLEVPNSNPAQTFRHSHQYQISHHQNQYNRQTQHQDSQYQQQSFGKNEPTPHRDSFTQFQLYPSAPVEHQTPPPPAFQHSAPPQHHPVSIQSQEFYQKQQLPQSHPAQDFQPPPQQHPLKNPTSFVQHSSGAPTTKPFRFPPQNPTPVAPAKTSFNNNNNNPTKYRGQQTQHKPIPIPIQNFQGEQQQQTFNKPVHVGPPAQAPPPQPQQNFEYENKYNKQQFQYSKTAQKQNQQQIRNENNQYVQQQSKYHTQSAAQLHGGLTQESTPNLGSGQNGFNNEHQFHQQFTEGISPELIKSLPRFEQHITETVDLNQINQPFGRETDYSSLVDNNLAFNEFASLANNHNHVIHNIPAPHLGPSTPHPHLEVGPTPLTHQFNQQSPTVRLEQFPSSTPNPSFGHYVTQSPHYVSSTVAPQNRFYSSTSQPHYHSVDQLQIVTPSPTIQTHFAPQQQQQQQNQQQQQIQQHQQYQQHQTQRQQQEQHQLQQQRHQELQQNHRQHQEHYQQQQQNHQHHQEQQQNRQQYIQYTQNENHQHQPHVIPNSQPRPTAAARLPSPGHSVSTIHTEALPEIEQRKNNPYNQNYQNNQNFVQISARNKQVNDNQFRQQEPSSSSTTTTAPPTSESSKTKISAVLPDEVPDELRQQLLSSGILDNADISVLDYDKIGATALENLPPEHLAHFYGAGGGSQISESQKILTVVKPNGEKIDVPEKQIGFPNERSNMPKKQNVDLKVVRFDSNNQKTITDKYIKQDSTVLPTVDMSSNQQYNRYLPLKISGTQFPIPDVSELRNRKIASVVVLAPVDSLQSLENDGRQERDIVNSREIKFIAGDSLKQLLKKPTRENFRKWLEKEAKTDINFQSVVLLVVKTSEDQDIYMYDINTKNINRLSGELSSAFVKVAEENADSENLESAQISDSGIVERMSTRGPLDTYSQEAGPAGSNINGPIAKLPAANPISYVSINSPYSTIEARN